MSTFPGKKPELEVPSWVEDLLEDPSRSRVTTKAEAYTMTRVVAEEAWPEVRSPEGVWDVGEPRRPIPGLDEYVRDYAAWLSGTSGDFAGDANKIARGMARETVFSYIQDWIRTEADMHAMSERRASRTARTAKADPYADVAPGETYTFADLTSMTGRSRRSVQDDMNAFIESGTWTMTTVPSPSGGRPAKVFKKIAR